jgi:hypothetical protein
MRLVGIALAATWLFFVTTAEGVEVVFLAGATTATRTDGGLVAGQTFNTFAPFGSQTFNSLGFIDVGEDGLVGSYDVGIWDQSQTLLASTTVTPSSPLIGGFRYAAIPPTVIPAGQSFTIGALIPPSPSDPWLEVQFVVLGVGFTGAGTGQYDGSLSLIYPATFDDTVYGVVNASTQVVPEPASLALFAGGAVLLTIRRLRSRF